MQALYDVPAPAKLNLFLHITGQRADGYHLLQSVFILVDWADTLHFEATKSPNISREDLNIPLLQMISSRVRPKPCSRQRDAPKARTSASIKICPLKQVWAAAHQMQLAL